MFTGKLSTLRAPKSDKPTLHFVESGETTFHSRNQTQYKPAKSTCSIRQENLVQKWGHTWETQLDISSVILRTIIRYNFLITLPYHIIYLQVTKRRHHFLEISDFINHAGKKRMQIRILVGKQQWSKMSKTLVCSVWKTKWYIQILKNFFFFLHWCHRRIISDFHPPNF